MAWCWRWRSCPARVGRDNRGRLVCGLCSWFTCFSYGGNTYCVPHPAGEWSSRGIDTIVGRTGHQRVFRGGAYCTAEHAAGICAVASWRDSFEIGRMTQLEMQLVADRVDAAARLHLAPRQIVQRHHREITEIVAIDAYREATLQLEPNGMRRLDNAEDTAADRAVAVGGGRQCVGRVGLIGGPRPLVTPRRAGPTLGGRVTIRIPDVRRNYQQGRESPFEQPGGDAVAVRKKGVGEGAAVHVLPLGVVAQLQGAVGRQALAQGVARRGGEWLIRCAVAAELRRVQADEAQTSVIAEMDGIAVVDIGDARSGAHVIGDADGRADGGCAEGED